MHFWSFTTLEGITLSCASILCLVNKLSVIIVQPKFSIFQTFYRSRGFLMQWSIIFFKIFFVKKKKKKKKRQLPICFRLTEVLYVSVQPFPWVLVQWSIKLYNGGVDLMKLLFHIKFLLLKIKSCLRAKPSRKKISLVKFDVIILLS